MSSPDASSACSSRSARAGNARASRCQLSRAADAAASSAHRGRANHVHGTVPADEDDHVAAPRAPRAASRSSAAPARTRAASTPPTSARASIGDCFFLSPLMATARINPRPGRDSWSAAPIGAVVVGDSVYRGQALRRRRATSSRTTSTTASSPTPTGDAALRAVRRHVGRRPGAVGDAAREGVGRARGGQQTTSARAADGLRAVTGKSSTCRKVADRAPPDHPRHPQRGRRRHAPSSAAASGP